jgi:predicted transcriptional regulator
MFYAANAVLLELGYKTQHAIAHKVTADALIVLVYNKLRKGLIEEYESIQAEALEIASVKADEIVSSFDAELDKRARFQYNMLEETKQNKAETSVKRATEFLFEMRKLIKNSYKRPQDNHMMNI